MPKKAILCHLTLRNRYSTGRNIKEVNNSTVLLIKGIHYNLYVYCKTEKKNLNVIFRKKIAVKQGTLLFTLTFVFFFFF